LKISRQKEVLFYKVVSFQSLTLQYRRVKCLNVTIFLRKN
ncbi:MAG: hypothetical protein ACI89R_000750, partial [Candidatus Azotimanducaceae bacterium]